VTLRMTHDGIAVFTALAMEARAVTRALRPQDRSAVTVIGPAAASLPDLAASREIRAIIVAGLAGGLDPDLVRGDVIVQGIAAPPRRARPGTIYTSRSVLETPGEKARIRGETGADVVDMEHAVVAHRPRGADPAAQPPVIGVRAVSDPAHVSLPAFMALLVKRDGTTDTLAAIRLVVSRPRCIPALLRAGRDASAACRSLGGVVATVLEQIRSEHLDPP
jgi:adenosylhomocysteine nucleosidase